MNGNNGIARAPNGTFYVANCMAGGLSILDEQADHTLVLIDVIPTGMLEFTHISLCASRDMDKIDRGMDNVSIDSKGHVWAAGKSAYALTDFC
jgi:sugar lactone lactonase YvrE